MNADQIQYMKDAYLAGCRGRFAALTDAEVQDAHVAICDRFAEAMAVGADLPWNAWAELQAAQNERARRLAPPPPPALPAGPEGVCWEHCDGQDSIRLPFMILCF